MGTLKILVNDRWIEPRAPYGSPALDFIRGEMGLTGTKEGCREGDCGACAVLVGEFAESTEGQASAASSTATTGTSIGRAPAPTAKIRYYPLGIGNACFGPAVLVD